MKAVQSIQVEAFSEKYLGLPTTAGRIASGTFDHLSERARGRIQGWSEKLLACAGREILLKTVVQAIPTYPMSTFLLTKKVCKSIIFPMQNIFGAVLLTKSLCIGCLGRIWLHPSVMGEWVSGIYNSLT